MRLSAEPMAIVSENLPQFIQISVKDKIIKATKSSGVKRVSKIKQIDHNAGKLIMQGVEDGRGWNIVISEETGKLSATVAGDRVGFIVFGACTAI
jgi:fructose-1,6-bisphosphatase/inositol monophosphatase family enzyme